MDTYRLRSHYPDDHTSPCECSRNTLLAVCRLTLFQLTNTPSLPLPSWLSFPYLPLNVGTFGAVLYSTLYVLMEPIVGGIMAPLIIGGTAYSNYLTSTYGKPANVAAGVIQAAAWILQFVGHGKFEGRAGVGAEADCWMRQRQMLTLRYLTNGCIGNLQCVSCIFWAAWR